MLDRLAAEAGVGAASPAAMIERAETEKNADQLRVLQEDAKETLQLLFRVAVVDGELCKDEAIVLNRLAGRLDVSDSKFRAWLSQAISFVKKRTVRNNAAASCKRDVDGAHAATARQPSVSPDKTGDVKGGTPSGRVPLVTMSA